MLKNNKGFSLIELMVVVAIIAILATIAIPSYQGFQAKARQKEGFALLNAYYTSSQATFAEVGAFPGDFIASGFQPSGQLSYRLVAQNMATATFPMFGSAGNCVNTSTMACSCTLMGTCTDADFRTWDEPVLGAMGALGAAAPMTAPVTAGNMFTAAAASWISTTAQMQDEYTINERKTLQMVTDGLN